MKSKKGKGFASPNYTQTPNTLFELLPVLSNAELRITLALVRETHGWHRRRTDRLSVPELAALAGLSESSAKTGIKEGLTRGTLKRFKVRDSQNRPTFKYGLVITDQVTREEFERPKKQAENAVQAVSNVHSSGQNLTGSEIDGMNDSSGQILTGCPVDSPSQNLTRSNKEERNHSEGKKEEEHNAVSDAVEITAQRDDDSEIEETGQTQVEGKAKAPSPITDHEVDLAGGNPGEDDTTSEDVPAAAPATWDPADVNAELERLTNRRWLQPWKAKGATSLSIPLIQEVDSSGVNRHLIAQTISPEYLAEIVARVRAELVVLKARANQGEAVQIFSFQHMLIQALQRVVDRTEAIRALVAETNATATDRPGSTPTPIPQQTTTPREWQVGDLVIHQRCRYQVELVADTYIDLYDDTNGTVKIVRNTRDYDALRPLEQAREAS